MAYKMEGFGKKSGHDETTTIAKKKHGGYHQGQVSDAKTEEMNDNIAMGKGPAKPKSVVSARPKTIDTDKPTLIAADGTNSTAPTFSDFIEREKEIKKDPDYQRAKKVNKKLLG